MFRLNGLFVLALVACSGVKSTGAELPHYPGLQGHGSKTVGGSGRHLDPPATSIITVSNLDDSGPGSLRAALETKGPRTVIFGVSGTIVVTTPLVVTEPFLTVAGQTAPTGGITIYGRRLIIKTHDVVLRHLRLWASDEVDPAKASDQDCITLWGSKDDSFEFLNEPAKAPNASVFNIVLDHLTVLWGMDENVSTYLSTSNVTLSGCLIAEPLRYTKHPDIAKDLKKANDAGKKLLRPPHHSMALLLSVDTKRVSVFETMIANSVHRNPRIMPGTEVEFVNCVVFNWGPGVGDLVEITNSKNLAVPTWLRLVGNTFKPGPESMKLALVNTGKPPPMTILQSDNVYPSRVFAEPHKDVKVLSDAPKDPLCAISKFRTALGSYPLVVNNVGARPWARDEQELRISEQVRMDKGAFIDSPKGLMKGYPLNGKTQRPIAQVENNLPANPNVVGPTGYTRLEVWMEKFVLPVPAK